MKTLFVTLSLIAVAAWAVPAHALAPTANADSALCGGCGSVAKAGVPLGSKAKPKPGAKAKCPVMKQVFTVSAKTEWSYYKGLWYGYCCPGCKAKFDKNPASYAGR